MRFSAVFLALTTATLIAQQANQPRSASARQESCSIKGLVVNAITGEPLKKATINLGQVGNASGERYETTTTAGGRFAIGDIEPGQYHIWADRRGYSSTVSTTGKARGRTTLSLDPGQHLEGIVLRMPPQAVITGRALDEDGDALPNVGVYLLRYAFRRGKRQLEECDQASTNDLGEYRMFGLSPGKYYLRAATNDFLSSRDYDSGRGYTPVYYPAAADPAGAKAIELEPGALLRGIDITLIKVQSARVRGRVVDPTSKPPLQGVSVMLRPRDESRYLFLRNFASGLDPQGNFEIKSVVPGSYILVANKRAENKQYQAQLLLDVDASDIENVVLELAPPGELKGQVRVEGQPVANPAEMHIQLEEEQPSTGGVGGRLRPDGSFTISDVGLGHYRIDIFGASDNYYMKSARLGDREVLESGMDLTRGIGGPLEITLSSNGGRVEGVVLNANDEPEQDATVVLVPDEPRRGQWRLYREVTTDQYGRFTIKGIAPGGYKLFAWEEIEDNAYEDPDFLKEFEGLGEPRTIREGSHESAQLKLIPAGDQKTAPNQADPGH